MKSNEFQSVRELLLDRRQALKLSSDDVAKRAEMDHSTYWRIETGRIISPQVDKARAIAEALDMSCIDMFTALGWVPSNELPSISPYLRLKYGELPPEAFHRIEGYLLAQCEQYGVSFDFDHYEPVQNGEAA